MYYLPRDVSGKVHNCCMGWADRDFDPFVSYETFVLENKGRVNLSYDEWTDFLDEWNQTSGYWEEPIDMDFFDMIQEGKMFEIKNSVDEQLITIPAPYKKLRPNGVDYDLKLPTDDGYQLEYLGQIYEIMNRLEDAKKCYDLQYECTKEPELLVRSKTLEKKIQDTRYIKKFKENIPENLEESKVKSILDSTELHIRNYIVKIFDNDFTEFFKKNPKLLEDSEKIRKKNENSLCYYTKNSVIDTLTIGTLAHILKISRGEGKSKFDDTCKICKKSWKKNEKFFIQKIPKVISCIDRTCFIKQGGIAKEFRKTIIYKILSISDVRNAIAHPQEYDQEMIQKLMKEACATCDIINLHIEDFLKNKTLP